MRFLLLFLLLLHLQVNSFSQTDTRLLSRLDSVLKATERLDFKTVMEWCFLNIEKEDNRFSDKILSKDLQNKIKEYRSQ